MLITDYTTYAEVRATLGVDSREMPDDTIELNLYSLGLLADLQDIDSGIPAAFATVESVDEADRTDAEQLFHDAVKLFAPYSVGVQLSTSLSMFAPKTITDGKASVTRDSGSPYKAAIALCQARFDQARARLDARYADYAGATETDTFRPLMGAISPLVDPVVGE